MVFFFKINLLITLKCFLIILKILCYFIICYLFLSFFIYLYLLTIRLHKQRLDNIDENLISLFFVFLILLICKNHALNMNFIVHFYSTDNLTIYLNLCLIHLLFRLISFALIAILLKYLDLICLCTLFILYLIIMDFVNSLNLINYC